MEALKARIKPHFNTPENINGCLKGTFDDFLSGFDTQIELFKQRVSGSRSHWEQACRYAENFEEKRQGQLSEAMKKLTLEMQTILNPTIYPEVLKDLEAYGVDYRKEDTFRWPSVEDLLKMDLKEPLKLK